MCHRKTTKQFSDIKTFKSLLDNLPTEQFTLQQTNSEEVRKIMKTSVVVMIVPLQA